MQRVGYSKTVKPNMGHNRAINEPTDDFQSEIWNSVLVANLMNQIHFVIFVLLIGLFPTVPVGFQSLHGMGELRKDPACYPPVVRCR